MGGVVRGSGLAGVSARASANRESRDARIRVIRMGGYKQFLLADESAALVDSPFFAKARRYAAFTCRPVAA